MTAVEWFANQLGIKNGTMLEQAKEMELEQQQKMVDNALTNYELGWADRKKQFSLYEHKETITSADTITSSQTEISDEEIEEYAKRNAFQYYEFITGAKWYREQLKKKQCIQ